MKLRILGDSVRLRLSQSDVQMLLETGQVEETTHFVGAALRYVARRSDTVESMTAALDGTSVIVDIPTATVQHWGTSDEITLKAEQPVEEGRTLQLLVEKDFKCAVPRPGEEDYDGFEHPDVSC